MFPRLSIHNNLSNRAWLAHLICPCYRRSSIVKMANSNYTIWKKHIFFCSLKTHSKLHWPGQQLGQLRCQMNRYTPATLKRYSFVCLFCFHHTHRCCWVFHIPFSLLPPAWILHMWCWRAAHSQWPLKDALEVRKMFPGVASMLYSPCQDTHPACGR